MKPGFALLLSHDGLTLSHRTSEGWLRIGEVKLDSPDVAGALAELRAQAVEIAKAQGLAPLRTKLVLPNSEILYDTVSVEGVTSPDYNGAIRESLDGRTPYALDELCYDYVVGGSEAQVAVVARETLAEAEAFAVEHRLAPVCFAAVPPKGAFSGEAMFGTTKASEELLGPDETLERDMAPVVLLGEATPPGGAKPLATQADAGGKADAGSTADGADAARENAGREATAGAKTGPPTFASARLPDGPAVPKAPTPEPRSATPTPDMAPSPGKDAAGPGTHAAETGPAAAESPPRKTTQPRTEKAPPPPRDGAKSRPVGLVLTVALLVALLLVGVFAALTGSEDATERSGPEPSPVETADTGPEDTAPAQDQPVAAMTTGPSAFSPAPSITASPFASVATPEEVAEGDEASVESSPGDGVAQRPAGAVLPDIDEVPEAAISAAETAPDAKRPGLIETETRYAATGIWQRSPDPLLPIPETGVGDLYVAALDREIGIEDALALPAYRDERDLRPITPQPPVAPGQFFELGADGRVAATPEGTLTPDGVMVFSEPEARPDPRPSVTPATTDADLAVQTLAGLRPPARPQNVTELQERAVLDGRSRAELGAVTPPIRPASIQELAETPAPDLAEAGAMAVSLVPDARPADLAQRAASQRQSQQSGSNVAAASTAAPRATGQPTASRVAASPPPQTRDTAPSIPTTASVARQATLENALPLNRINLIGVYGTPNSRRALIRLASGRYVKVEVGDRVDGGRVAAIGEASLQYTKGGRNITLEMPRG